MLRQPRFYAALDQGGSIAMRDFRAMRDLHVGYAMVDQIEAMIELFDRCSMPISRRPLSARVWPAIEIRLSQIVLTALAREALDQRIRSRSIEASRLSELHRKIMTPGGRPAKLSNGFHKRCRCDPREQARRWSA